MPGHRQEPATPQVRRDSARPLPPTASAATQRGSPAVLSAEAAPRHSGHPLHYQLHQHCAGAHPRVRVHGAAARPPLAALSASSHGWRSAYCGGASACVAAQATARAAGLQHLDPKRAARHARDCLRLQRMLRLLPLVLCTHAHSTPSQAVSLDPSGPPGAPHALARRAGARREYDPLARRAGAQCPQHTLTRRARALSAWSVLLRPASAAPMPCRRGCKPCSGVTRAGLAASAVSTAT